MAENNDPWHNFGENLPLSDAEQAEWNKMVSMSQRDDALAAQIAAATEAEREALQRAIWSKNADSIAGILDTAAAMRQLQRAQLTCWRKILENKEV